MTVLSPLILLPHLNRAKRKMISLISKCILCSIEREYLSNLLSNIVSDYLFVKYSQFYDINKIENNVN